MDSKKQTWIISLGDTASLDVNVVGGKAASLAEMIAIGIRVPPGFCLTVSAYRQFLAHHICQVSFRWSWAEKR